MSLSSGTRVGPYTIVAAVGAGGMGEVYRARDPRLDRDVAVKVLPGSVSADPDRLRRFEQEARAAAALNHPNILAVYDVGSHDGAPYIVSELLEGETLRERLSQPAPMSQLGGGSAVGDPAAGATRGLSVRRALDYGTQITRGLAAAHDQHIVHRDLKPENIFITTDGRVKILDFGLAKLTQVDAAETESETKVVGATQPGMLLGTLGYMSPEQVRGQAVDHRTDIFAFGVMLYEMLTGQRAFERSTTADTLVAIVKEEPPTLSAAGHDIPPALERIVDRCLEKSPASRFQSATDLSFALESLSSSSGRTEGLPAAAGPLPPARAGRGRLAWIVAGIATAALVAAGWLTARSLLVQPAQPQRIQFLVRPPAGTIIGPGAPLALSPDGRQLVFGASAQGVTSLWVRSISDAVPQRLAGTEGASYPFWSPDGRWLAFFSASKLMKIRIEGGPPVALCDAPAGRGGTWNSEGTIVFAPVAGGTLSRVPAAGGTPTFFTTLEKDEVAHRWPTFLPDGRHFLFMAARSLASGRIWIGSLDSPERTQIGESNSNGLFGSNHLWFVRAGTLMAEPFDPARRQTTGEAFPVAEGVGPYAGTLWAPFSASNGGALAYRRGSDATARLTWFDRAGAVLRTVGDPGAYLNLALSPDERRLAVSHSAGTPSNIDIWLVDLTRDSAPSRFTFDSGAEFDPAWSPDGANVFFTSTRTGPLDLYRHAASGAGQDELILSVPRGIGAPDISGDGRYLVFSQGGDINVLPLAGDRKPVPYLNNPFTNGSPEFSPDGKWIAYTSNETGRQEVYVQSFPAGGGKYLISREGGSQPRWRGDGRELFFLAPDLTLMSANIVATPEFRSTVPRKLFSTGMSDSTNNHPYVVTKDGQRFLLPAEDREHSPEITVVLNWAPGAEK